MPNRIGVTEYQNGPKPTETDYIKGHGGVVCGYLVTVTGSGYDTTTEI